jgi:hypothetical protein
MNFLIITTESVMANIHTINVLPFSHMADIKVKVMESCACHEGDGRSRHSVLLILNLGLHIGA